MGVNVIIVPRTTKLINIYYLTKLIKKTFISQKVLIIFF